ncbi:hypothetical protein ATANTOWER_023285 [Ataeniobius toweri]|uniref:Uncharacterized protein n=1 Tax=Ataeniobius toweri TaxID=208326 RepID=A0ABU7AH19_9TELE|nr:hypothetical protein [Ataeniobius toweri]
MFHTLISGHKRTLEVPQTGSHSQRCFCHHVFTTLAYAFSIQVGKLPNRNSLPFRPNLGHHYQNNLFLHLRDNTTVPCLVCAVTYIPTVKNFTQIKIKRQNLVETLKPRLQQDLCMYSGL